MTAKTVSCNCTTEEERSEVDWTSIMSDYYDDTYYGGQEEGDEGGTQARCLVGVDRLQVDVTQQPLVHWLVPFAGVLVA
jgi:hypothetical protein